MPKITVDTNPLPYGERFRWGHRKTIHGPIPILRAAYKQFKEPTLFHTFPLRYETRKERHFNAQGQVIDSSDLAIPCGPLLDFYANVEDLYLESYSYLPYTHSRYVARGDLILHEFVAPFDSRNTKFFLEAPLDLRLRGEEAFVLLDYAQEHGFTLPRDFEILKQSNQIKLVTEDIRLCMSELLGTAPSVDVLFTTRHPIGMRLQFELGDS